MPTSTGPEFRWFAWRPTRTVDRGWRWLVWVRRHRVWYDFGDHAGSYFETSVS